MLSKCYDKQRELADTEAAEPRGRSRGLCPRFGDASEASRARGWRPTKWCLNERGGPQLFKSSTRSKIPSPHFENGRIKKKSKTFFFRSKNFEMKNFHIFAKKSLMKSKISRKKSKTRKIEKIENRKFSEI